LLEEAFANARLIIASPDLLKTLEDCADLLDHIHSEMGVHSCTVDCSDIGKRVDRARVLISKVRGPKGENITRS
jgi:hypothetical protein